MEQARVWVGVFNSRKPRLRLPGEGWLEDLRFVLPQVHSKGFGLASSIGTLTYDLVTTYAQSMAVPLLLWLPTPLATLFEMNVHAPFGRLLQSRLTLTCLTRDRGCSPATRAVCRDRMLAELTDIHCVLQIRRGGNLHSILETEHSRAPRVRWDIQRPSGADSARVDLGPMYSVSPGLAGATIKLPIPNSAKTTGRKAALFVRRPDKIMRLEEVDWTQLLCHYTRACVGPWPGQSYEEFLVALLEAERHNAHTALDTLLHMVAEDRIRASAKLLKGGAPAISFTSIAPFDLTQLRQWNKALARWTVEPYGFGIDRKLLKHLGIRPVVYGPPEIYARLKEKDRFRFQKHMPPASLWKHEREWRYPKDLVLSAIPASKRLIFVRTVGEAAQAAAVIGREWSLVALER